jgi:hypothetical protein
MAGRNLLAEEPAGRNLLAEPKKEKEPGVAEKAGAVAYGLGTSTLGTLGDVEKFLNPGKNEKFMGRETIFPTTEEAQKGYEMIGIPKPREAVKGYQTAGELAPAVGAGVGALYKLGKYGVGKIGSLMGGGKELAETLKSTTAGRVSEEAAKAGQKAGAAESRAGAAEKIIEREAGKPVAEYGQMPGVIMGTEAGAAKAIPQSMDEIGSSIKQTADKIYNDLKTTRAQNAATNKADAFGFARSKEFMGEKVQDTKSYENVLNQIDSLLKDKTTGLAVASLDAIKNPLLQIRRAIDPRYVDEATGVVMGRPISFQGLEDLRRFLRDRSYGIPSEGFDAINQQKAGKLADSIEKVMSDFSNGKIDKFISQYRKDSEPLRVFQTKVGKALIDEQLLGKGANYAAVPAQSIPGKVFKSKEDYAALIDALGGNKQLAQDAAQKYFVAQLEGIKDATGVENFVRNNRTMLKETGVYDMANRYAKTIADAEKRGARATGMKETRTATAAEQRALQQDLTRLGTDVERARDVKEIGQQATSVANRLEKAGVITLEQRDRILRDINKIEDLQKKREMIQKVIRWGLGGGTLYGAYSGATSYMGR